jgi:hypothetical protein
MRSLSSGPGSATESAGRNLDRLAGATAAAARPAGVVRAVHWRGEIRPAPAEVRRREKAGGAVGGGDGRAVADSRRRRPASGADPCPRRSSTAARLRSGGSPCCGGCPTAGDSVCAGPREAPAHLAAVRARSEGPPGERGRSLRPARPEGSCRDHGLVGHPGGRRSDNRLDPDGLCGRSLRRRGNGRVRLDRGPGEVSRPGQSPQSGTDSYTADWLRHLESRVRDAILGRSDADDACCGGLA